MFYCNKEVLQIVKHMNIHHYACSTEETFSKYFEVIPKLQNYSKIVEINKDLFPKELKTCKKYMAYLNALTFYRQNPSLVRYQQTCYGELL